MHKCPDCGKIYQSQSSLTRHAHNHRRTKQHICRACGVAFGRKDLLSRHIQIHERNSAIGSPPRTPQASSYARRRRCHTACIRCAELRRKCNGRHPCDPCLHTGAVCDYSRRSGRLSRIQFDDPSIQNGIDSPELQQQQSGSCYSSPGPVGPVDLESSEHVEMPLDGPISSPEISQQITFFPLDSECDSNLLCSWPWIHESLYLPTDESSRPAVVDPSIWKDMSRSSTTLFPATAPLSPPQLPLDMENLASQDLSLEPYNLDSRDEGEPRLASSLASDPQPASCVYPLLFKPVI
jgi:hypothetical protein